MLARPPVTSIRRVGRGPLFTSIFAASLLVFLLVGLQAPAAAQKPDAWASASATEPWPLPKPSQATGGYVAKVLAPSRGRKRLLGRSPRVPLSTRTSWSGQAQILLVLQSATYKGEKWLRLRLANRPTGSAAWFRRDRMMIRRIPWFVRVKTRTKTVLVYFKGRRARKFRAVVGHPSTPTPRGLGAIYERNRQPGPEEFIGPWAIALTFTSNVLENYGGGPGRIAIHGRSGESLLDPLGTARSHGCIRISNGPVRWIARKVPRGTPIRITG